MSEQDRRAWEEVFDVPDHQLIISTRVNMVRILGREHIIRNIRPNVLRVILPLDRGRHALHLTDNLALCQDLACVRITLDVILSTLPSPLCAPFDAGAGGAVKVGAL